MKILYWNELLNNNTPYFSKGCGISIGSFDGLHKGHRLLLSSLKQAAQKNNILCGCFTFYRPLPSIKKNNEYSGDISTLSQRLQLFEELGMDFVIIAEFNRDFAKNTGTQFLELLINHCNLKLLAEGVDFRCGYKGATGVSEIKEFCTKNNLQAIFVEPVFYQDGDVTQRVSSSNIRALIQKGCFSLVKDLLQRNYQLDLSAFKNNEIQKSDIIQVLPFSGIYKNEKDVTLKIDENSLKLSSYVTNFCFQ